MPLPLVGLIPAVIGGIGRTVVPQAARAFGQTGRQMGTDAAAQGVQGGISSALGAMTSPGRHANVPGSPGSGGHPASGVVGTALSLASAAIPGPGGLVAGVLGSVLGGGEDHARSPFE